MMDEKLIKLLESVGIQVMTDDKEYRNAVDMLKELSLKWSSLNDCQQKSFTNYFLKNTFN
jgi:hypothetical protein